MRDGGPASDAPALLILPRRRERRRLRFLAPRAAGSGCCLADLGVRTPRWNRSKRERSPQVLSLHPRPGRIGESFTEVRTAAGRSGGGAGAERARAGRGRATPAGSGRAPSSSRRTRRRLASLRRLARRSSASPRPESPSAPPAGAGPAPPGRNPGGLGGGWRWRTGCLALLSGLLDQRGSRTRPEGGAGEGATCGGRI